MHGPRLAHAKGAITAVLLLTVALGCKSNNAAAPAPSTTTAAPTTTAPAQPGSVGPCSPESLTAAVQAKYQGGVLNDVVCDGPFGAATVTGAGLTAENVALFRVSGETWAVVGNGDAGDPNVVPPDFSVSTYSAWKAKRESRVAPPKATTTTRKGTSASVPPVTTTGEPIPGNPTCDSGKDTADCETSTTKKPPVTTPDGQTVPPTTSQFCRFNYADPRCVANPEFPG